MFSIKTLSVGKIRRTSKSKKTNIQRLTSAEKCLPIPTFEPQSRYEAIKTQGMVFPKSTNKKIIFVSNTHANGFVNERNIDFPDDIAIQKMKEEVDMACYGIWK